MVINKEEKIEVDTCKTNLPSRASNRTMALSLWSATTMLGPDVSWGTCNTQRCTRAVIFLNISLPQHPIVPCPRTQNSDTNKFVQIPTRINTCAYSFYPRVIRAWNLLPNDIIGLSSIKSFHQAMST